MTYDRDMLHKCPTCGLFEDAPLIRKWGMCGRCRGSRCEGCGEPFTGHDPEGVPLCDSCGGEKIGNNQRVDVSDRVT